MVSKKICIPIMIMVFSLCTPFAAAEVSVDRTSAPEKDSTFKDIPKGFNGAIKRFCQKGERVYVLYTFHENKSESTRLSLFEKGQETILWTHIPEDLAGPGIPSPDFILCNFNNNDISDCILIYTIVDGVGQSIEKWKRYLTVFVDNKQVGSPVEIAESDLWINRDFKVNPENDNGDTDNCSSDIGPAYQKEACVFLTRQLDFTKICVVNRIYYFRDMGKKVTREQLITIGVVGDKLQKSLLKINKQDVKDAYKVKVPENKTEKEKYDIVVIKRKKEFDEFLFKLLCLRPVFI